MPLYPGHLAQEFERKRGEFTLDNDGRVAVEAFQDAAEELLSDFTKAEIEDRLSQHDLPAALPTVEYQANGSLVVPFDPSAGWESHEAVNTWARDQLEGVTTLAADGSQIDPIQEFEKPVGLVQSVWIANHHSTLGEYEEGVRTVVLTPEDLLFQNPNTGLVQVDREEVPVARFETEMDVLVQRIEEYGDADPVPVVLFDGPFVLSFTQTFFSGTQERYSEALSRLLAAGKHHGVPVVGYTAGSRASDLAKMIEYVGLVDADRSIRDYQLLDRMIENWGDRTQLFTCRRDNTLNWLQTTYEGEEYDFSEDVLFTYMNTNPGSQIDRIDMPRWILEEELVELVLDVIRAEAGVGRGYPEILQAVDTDAVISHRNRDEFLRLYQSFTDEHDIELRWNSKALSKQRRRR